MRQHRRTPLPPLITLDDVTATVHSHVRATRRRPRIESVDLLRGIIMILMALDHTRDYLGAAAVNPTNLATTTVPLFFTRWVTHFCAPTFFLLTGTGAYLAGRRRGTRNLSYFLLTRGAWLILLELTVMRFFWQFNVDYQVTMLTVLWALGWAMIVLAALVWLPLGAIAAFGGVLVLLHDLLDGVRAASLGALAPLWTVLHAPGFLVPPPGHTVFVAYVLVPWVGVTALGYVLGAVYDWEAPRRRAFLLRAGIGCVIAFVVLRWLDVYGDPAPWSVQRSATFTALSFIDTTKYPPSLLFLLMTLGPALLLLRATDGGTPEALRPAVVYGRVPMFYYLAHVLVIHLVATVASLARYGTVRYAVTSPSLAQFPMTQPPGWAAPLPVVWIAWIGVVIALYPLCRWYAALRQRRTDWWLSYL
jgi:uncharacterized membrane protein